jgi:hypothetical protein
MIWFMAIIVNFKLQYSQVHFKSILYVDNLNVIPTNCIIFMEEGNVVPT